MSKRIYLTVLALIFSATIALPQLLLAESQENKRYWIKFERGAGDKIRAALQQFNTKTHYRFESLNAYSVSMSEAVKNKLEKNPHVLLVEEDPKRYPMGQTVTWGVEAIQALDIWDADDDGFIDPDAPTGSGRMVCIIDSGLYTGHEEFSGVPIVGGYPEDAWNEDSCGHGTHVAGTIAAANNDKGVVGVTPGSTSLYIVKIFDGEKCSPSFSSTVVKAAQICASVGANVINMSLAGKVSSFTERRAFQALYDQGLLSVAAAGNDGSEAKFYPASYDSVMSVAAIDSYNWVAPFSQRNSQVEISAPGVAVTGSVPYLASLDIGGIRYLGSAIKNTGTTGAGGVNGPLVDGGFCETGGSWLGKIVMCERGVNTFFEKLSSAEAAGAVGVVIYNNVSGEFVGTLGFGNVSAIPAISLSQVDGQTLLSEVDNSATLVKSSLANGYETWNGTSMATPHVAGAAALIWSSNPSLSNVEIRDALTSTALDLGTSGRDNSYGFGLVQAYDAWEALGMGDGGGDVTPPVISNVSAQKIFGRWFKIEWTTNEPATSKVITDCCGEFTSDALLTSHKRVFRGTKGLLYTFSVESRDGAGNTQIDGPYQYQN